MAETFINENIDPSLRPIDPTKDIFLRIRSAGLTPAPAADNNDMDDGNDMPATPHFPVGPSTGPSINNPSVSYASLVKNKMALSDAASVALDQFCQVRICLSFSSRLIITSFRRPAQRTGRSFYSRTLFNCWSYSRKMRRWNCG
jgi:hypothetical protein